jgi:hypothetical protein
MTTKSFPTAIATIQMSGRDGTPAIRKCIAQNADGSMLLIRTPDKNTWIRLSDAIIISTR